MEIKKISYMHFFYIKQSDTTAFYDGTNKIYMGYLESFISSEWKNLNHSDKNIPEI